MRICESQLNLRRRNILNPNILLPERQFSRLSPPRNVMSARSEGREIPRAPSTVGPHRTWETCARGLEAPSGVEPLHRSFADCSLNHLGTAPRAHYSEPCPRISTCYLTEYRRARDRHAISGWATRGFLSRASTAHPTVETSAPILRSTEPPIPRFLQLLFP